MNLWKCMVLRPSALKSSYFLPSFFTCGFSRMTKKNGSAQRRRVFTYLIPHLFGNFCESFDPGSCKVRVTRSGSSDHTLQKLYKRAPATVFEGKLWNFRNTIRSSVPAKCVSPIFYIGDLKSGHFRDLPIISEWAKIKLPVLCFILSLYEWNHIR